MKLKEIALAVSGELQGDGDLEIRGVSGIREAGDGDLTFFADPRYAGDLSNTRASAVLMAKNGFRAPSGASVIYCVDPKVAYLEIAKRFSTQDGFAPGVHPTAFVGERVILGTGVSVGACAVVEDDVVLGAGVVLRPGVFVGTGCAIGEGSFVHPNASIMPRVTIGCRVIIHSGAVIGSDGFGYVPDGGRHLKVPQLGTVEIEDDVEIGANCTIDRGTNAATRIARGTKLDNLVHVGHNVTVGEDSLLIAQVGIGGSTRIGNRVVVAGQAGIGGHIEIGDGAVVGAQSGVTKSIPPKERWSGYPARPHTEHLRLQGMVARLPRLIERIEELIRRIARVEGGR